MPGVTCYKCGVCCFSDDSTATLTWSVTAQSGTGFCQYGGGAHIGCPATSGTIACPFIMAVSNVGTPGYDYLEWHATVGGVTVVIRRDCGDGHFYGTVSEGFCSYSFDAYVTFGDCDYGDTNDRFDVACLNGFPTDPGTVLSFAVTVSGTNCCKKLDGTCEPDVAPANTATSECA
jgi:hypothetical protein